MLSSERRYHPVLKIGDPLDEKADIGIIINNKQFAKVYKYVDEGLKRRRN